VSKNRGRVRSHRGARALNRGVARAAREVVNRLPAGSPAARVALCPARKLTRALRILVLLVVALVCVDLAIELAGSVGVLLADVAGVFSAYSPPLQ
tara:strand:+ start:834 stop:1121 length:288 start_codon:yes stop_codon:yes gene_type:complete